jgi:hypothetical protein
VGHFLGRQGIVSKIYARIGASRPQSVSIVGDFKIGKTSLIWYLMQEKIKKAFLDAVNDYIYVSVPVTPQTSESLDTFGEYLFTAINIQVPDKIQPSHPSGSSVYDDIKKLIDLSSRRNKKVIIFFDDFNLITQNDAFPLEFFSFMRSLANNYNLAYVTSSYEDLQKLCISKDVEESPFFNIFTNMTLKAFTEDEAEHLVRSTHNSGIDLTPEKEILLQEAGLFPYPLKMACNILFEMKSGSAIPSDGEIAVVFSDMFNSKIQGFYKILWERFEPAHREVFRNLIQSQKIPQNQSYLLDELVRKDYINMRNGKPALFSPVFQKFIMAKENITAESTNSLSNFFKRMWRFFHH